MKKNLVLLIIALALTTIIGKAQVYTPNNSLYMSSNNFVGVGDNNAHNPSVPFHVKTLNSGWSSMVENNGCIVYSAYGINSSDGYGSHIRVNNSRSDRYAFQVFNGSRYLMDIRTNGMIGIGTTTPSAYMHINANSGSLFRLHNPNGGESDIMYTSGSNSWEVGTGGTGTKFYFYNNGQYLMNLTTDGKLGIGKEPTHSLDVDGDINITNGQFKINGETVAVGGGGSSAWTEASGNVYRSTGKVGIGNSAPSKNLQISSVDDPNYEPCILRMDAVFQGSQYTWDIVNNPYSIGSLEFYVNSKTGSFDPNLSTGSAALTLSPGGLLTLSGSLQFSDGSVLESANDIGSGGSSLWNEEIENDISYAAGNVMIGDNTDKYARLQITNSDLPALLIDHSATAPWERAAKILVNHNQTKALSIVNSSSGSEEEVLTVFGSGTVAIGTPSSSSDAQLVVVGKIEAEEIEVKTLAATDIQLESLDVNNIAANNVVVTQIGADYVFEEDYNLRSIEEVEAFIKENRHLPDVAPASETEKGVNIAEFNETLLQKIEELTLYVIEQNKKIEAQQKEIDELKNCKP